MGFENAEDLKSIFIELNDWEERYRYIIELGKELPPIEEQFKTDEYKLFGCQSNVWLKPITSADKPNCLDFVADSDSQIVKGLISLVRFLLVGKSAQEVLDFDIENLFSEIHLREHLTPGRSDGLRHLIARIRKWATEKAF
ncbi:MAG: SufE family protein [Deltaproteobacteria bacterium]|nr:SufE family protein [Deltaproteobacteria bacterium]